MVKGVSDIRGKVVIESTGIHIYTGTVMELKMDGGVVPWFCPELR
jgi:hypothetical protein